MKHHRYAYSRCIGLVAAKCMLIFMLLGATGSAMGQALPHIGYCNYCTSTAAFANAAEQAAPDAAPGNGTPWTYPVYVINPANGNIQYFNVLVWYDWGDGQPESVDPGDSRASTESGGSVQSFGLQKEAYPGSGDPNVISAMQQAHTGAVQFAAALGGTVNIGDTGYTGESAVGLVGPENSSAGFNRMDLQNRLTDYYSGVRGAIFVGTPDFATRIANRYLGGSNYVSPNSRITVQFPDGTRIQLAITNINTGLNPDDLTVEFEVLPQTARLPDGSSVPQSAGQFDGFSYSGDAPLIDFLRDLAYMYGIPITGGGGGAIMCTRVDGGPLVCDLREY